LAKEVADTGIGQFEVAATPMQMAIVANTIRTTSITYPTILKNEASQTIHKGFISPYAQQEIKEAMYQVVNSKEGTAKCAFLHENFYQEALAYNRNIKDPSQQMWVPCAGYRYKFKAVNPNAFTLKDVKVYGKTGTAEKGKGKLYDGWFVAFTKSPRGDIVVATVVRNSGTGGTYSATITKRIIESWYRGQEKNKNK
jgi:cell division protein FtsI/penicillin-binding protein 2